MDEHERLGGPEVSALRESLRNAGFDADDGSTGAPATAVERYFMTPALPVPPEQHRALESTLSALKERVHELNVGQVATHEQILEVQEAVHAVANAGARLSAPIILPQIEQMEVRLVPASLLESMAELHSDETRYWTWLGILAGGLLGLFSGMVLNPVPIAQAAWVMTGLLLLMLLFVAIELKRVNNRIDSVRTKLFLSHPAMSAVAASRVRR